MMTKLDEVLEDLQLKLKINVEDINYFNDGATDSIVFGINNEFLVKVVDENTFITQKEFLRFYQDNYNFQKILMLNEKLGYIVFQYIDGEKYNKNTGISSSDMITKIYDIVNSYQKYNHNLYGYLGEESKSWYDFLKEEVEYSNEAVKDIEISLEKVNVALKKIKEVEIDKYLIHGDFGTHNFIINGNEVFAIDPMPVIGDYLYDFYFACLSNVNIFNKVDEEFIFSFFDRDVDYKRDLFLVVLYIRLCRCYVYNKCDIDIYLAWYNRF